MSKNPGKNKRPGPGLEGYRSVEIESMLEGGMGPASLGNLERLDLELLLLYQKIAPTAAEIGSRMYVFERVKRLVVSRLPGASVSPFGSCSTGLVVPSSDIDVNVQFGVSTEKEDVNKHLARIRAAATRADFVRPESLFHIRRCRIPILKLRDSIFGFRIDISINQANGIEAAKFVNHALKEYPYIKVFAILLKHFLAIRNQSDAATGGLNSYSQFLLLLSFFQLHPLVQRGAVSPLKNIGVLLMDFFQFYGCDFPYRTARVSVGRAGYVRNDTGALSIEDPTNPEWDVAAVCKNFDVVLATFRHAFRVMCAALKADVPPQKSLACLWFRRGCEDAEHREEVRRAYANVLGRRKK